MENYEYEERIAILQEQIETLESDLSAVERVVNSKLLTNDEKVMLIKRDIFS